MRHRIIFLCGPDTLEATPDHCSYSTLEEAMADAVEHYGAMQPFNGYVVVDEENCVIGIQHGHVWFVPEE